MLKLKEIRKQKGLTQKQISDIIGTSEATANRIENEVNVINNKQIVKLCEALDVRAGQLLGLEDLD